MSGPDEFESAAIGVPPLLPEHAPGPRHRVKGHDRTIPPKPVDPNVLTLPGMPVPEPAARKVPVKPHVRRNPRQPQEPTVTETDRRCPDDGACHHGCAEGACFRVLTCGPLSAAGYPNDEWPAEIVAAEEAKGLDPVAQREANVLGLSTEARARPNDPGTSHMAAAQVKPTASQVIVLRAFRTRETNSGRDALGRPGFQGWTDEEMTDYVQHREALALDGTRSNLSDSRIRSARKELQRAGLVQPTGERQRTRRGRLADVYNLTDEGRSLDLT